jgi:hypothetical protein
LTDESEAWISVRRRWQRSSPKASTPKTTEVERVTKDRRISILVRDATKFLVDLGMCPIPRIPRDPRTADDVLEAVGIIFERLWEGYTSGQDPWD